MPFKITPTPHRIIVQEDGFHYSGRLLIPENAQRRGSTGTVIEVGDAIAVVKVGDRVVFGMYSGTGLTFRDPKTSKDLPPMRALTEDEVIARLDGDVDFVELNA